jgi:hypothetical protein
MLEWGFARFLGPVEMCVAYKPQVMNKRMEMANKSADSIGSLTAGGRKPTGNQIALLQDRPVSDEVAIKQRVGTDSALTAEQGVIHRVKIGKRRERATCEGGHEEEEQATKSRVELREITVVLESNRERSPKVQAVSMRAS